MRRRGKNPNENPGVRPVTQIELDEKNHKKRIVLAAVLLAIGLAFLGYALFSCLSHSDGWTQIEPVAEVRDSVASDMVLLYELGASGRSSTAENKELATLYTELCIEAYRIFSARETFDGVGNLHAVNARPGEAVAVDPALYQALELIEESESRVLFTAPFFREYGNLFGSADDGLAEEYDPRKNGEIAAYFKELAAFTASSADIRLELLGDNTVMLVISDAYRMFAEENGIDTFADFAWTVNAFTVDYIADRLIEKGFTYGTLSSYDGFVRALDERMVEYGYHFYAFCDAKITDAVRLNYMGARSIVYLRSYPLYERDEVYYTYRSGERRHPYVDVNDGLCKNATDGMIAYAEEKGCAEVLLAMMPAYIADDIKPWAIAAMKSDGIYTLYAEETVIRYNDPKAKLTDLYQNETVTFTALLDE